MTQVLQTFPRMKLSPNVEQLANHICSAGGKPFVVGGSVRDHLFGIIRGQFVTPKDIDIEVFGLAPDLLEKALASKYRVDTVGRSFGVFKVQISESETIDISLPRKESKLGSGHRGFVVSPDPNMDLASAAARRDLTINSIAYDLNGGFLDPFYGVEDLKNSIIRHTSEAFGEDPLRVLRVCQFAGRFNFKIAPDTVEKCLTLAGELPHLSQERVWEEFKKLLLKSPKPSVGLNALIETGAIACFPELRDMIGVPQDPEWHPENGPHGSLWEHNCMVVDSAVRVLEEDGVVDEEERLIILLGALCHDFGKPSTTKMQDDRWRSHGHEAAGEKPTREFLSRIYCSPKLIEAVVPLVQHHLKPFHLYRDRASDSAIRRLALKVPLVRLCRVGRADYLGRTTPDALACSDSRTIPDIVWILSKLDELDIRNSAPKPLLMGRHLLDLGLKQGPEMGKILKAAFEVQLDGGFSDEAGALEYAKNILEK